MNTQTDDPTGDELIDVFRAQFSRPQAAFLARVPLKSVINWQNRGFISDLGATTPSGRWRFTVLEVVQLAVMGDLCARVQLLAPNHAAQVGKQVAQVGLESTHRGQIVRPNANVILSWTEDGEMQMDTADVRSPAYYPPARDETCDGYVPLRRRHLVIPATALFIDTMLRIQHMQEAEELADVADAD